MCLRLVCCDSQAANHALFGYIPPPPGALAISDSLMVVALRGSPAFHPASLRLRYEAMKLAVGEQPSEEALKAAHRELDAKRAALHAARPSEVPLRTSAMAHVRRVRLLLVDDVSSSANSEPVVQARMPEAFGYVNAETRDEFTSRAGAVIEVRGFSEQARLWEPLLERTMVCLKARREADEGGKTPTRLRVWLPRRVNFSLSQQYLGRRLATRLALPS